MEAVGPSSPLNPIYTYFNSKGIWLTYALLVWGFHICILSIPTISVALAWTITNVIHGVVMYIMLHYEKGSPFDLFDQGKARKLTQWEQFDHGEHFSPTKKFLMIVPIVLFLLASFYTKFNPQHFMVNVIVLLGLGLIPKLPQLYKVRLFNINRY